MKKKNLLVNLIKIFVVSYVKKIMFSFFEIKLKSTPYIDDEPVMKLKVFTSNTNLLFDVISQKYKGNIGFWEQTYLDFFKDNDFYLRTLFYHLYSIGEYALAEGYFSFIEGNIKVVLKTSPIESSFIIRI